MHFDSIYKAENVKKKIIKRLFLSCIDVVLLFLHFLVLSKAQYLFENRVALNPGLDGMRYFATAIIAHEQTQ